MTYTVWSNGRLVGESDLEGAFGENGFRYGTLLPCAEGESLIAIATGASRAVLALRGHFDDPVLFDAFRAASEAVEALQLELRDKDGDVIPTRFVAIRDNHYMAKVGSESLEEDDTTTLSPEQEAEIEAEVRELMEEWESNREPWKAEPEPAEFPQYSVQVQLIDPASLPPV